MNPQPLDLRDYHLPDAISWWPLAPGWWVLAAVFLIVIIGLVLYRRQRRRSPGRAALSVLAVIQTEWQKTGDDLALVQAISTHIRRIAMSYIPRNEVAGLNDREWLDFLDTTLGLAGKDKPFSQGVGEVLLTAPYAKDPVIDGIALLTLTKSWIRAISQRPQRGSRHA